MDQPSTQVCLGSRFLFWKGAWNGPWYMCGFSHFCQVFLYPHLSSSMNSGSCRFSQWKHILASCRFFLEPECRLPPPHMSSSNVVLDATPCPSICYARGSARLCNLSGCQGTISWGLTGCGWGIYLPTLFEASMRFSITIQRLCIERPFSASCTLAANTATVTTLPPHPALCLSNFIGDPAAKAMEESLALASQLMTVFCLLQVQVQ